MAFLSELIGKPVTDVDGKKLGILKDLIARQLADLSHPVIQALVISQKGKFITIPFSAVAVLFSPAIPLKCKADELQPYTPSEEDIYLARDVLDKQIIDTEGARVVRVNDLELLRANGKILVSNVDIGGLGILRRVGLGEAAKNVAARVKLAVPQHFLSWDDVELLRHDQFMRLKVPVDKVAELHPADVADILGDLNRLESGQFLEALSVEHLADTLEEVEPEYQASLVEGMPDEKVADLLEEMEPDEAADLLAELPKERSEDLLELMEKDEAADVRKLLAYPEESAGGIMTTEYAVVHPEHTAEQAIQVLRETGNEAETIFYVYVTDDGNHLIGVFSLSALIFAQPDKPVRDFMHKRVISVQLTDEQDDIAQMISKYDLLAVPVVDQENCLHGIVTADDALDKIIPTAWKKRLPRFYH
jgi:magnesium transporter